METIISALIGAVATILAAMIGRGIIIKLWKRKLTWDDALRTAQKLLSQIQESGWQPEIVLGIGRSGGIWGGWLAGNLGSLPFTVIDDRYTKDTTVNVDFPLPLGRDILLSLQASYPNKRRLMVVEGASSTGRTLLEFMKQFSKELDGYDVKFCVLYKNPASIAPIDFVGDSHLEPWPAKLPWHYTNLYRPYLRDMFFRNGRG